MKIDKYIMRYFEIYEDIALTEEDRQLYKKVLELFSNIGLKARIVKDRIRNQIHFRITNSMDEITNSLKKIQASISHGNAPQLSGKFPSFSITFGNNHAQSDLAGATVFAVSNIKKNTKVAQKMLIPANFGIGSDKFTKETLAKKVISNIPNVIKDPALAQFLEQLIEVALKKRPAVDPEVMDSIDPDTRRITGIDFGEILTPIMLADTADEIVFPNGNSMLADVDIKGRPYSVKSASGSGTSFKAIKEYMDKFQEGVTSGKIVLNKEEEKIHKFFRAFVDAEGKNVNKIVYASGVADTLEHQALAKLIGKNDFTYEDLITYSEGFSDYSEFLKAVYPVSIAGGYKIKEKDRPNGMPADHLYYLGKTDKVPKAKSAGKPSFDANPGAAGANILTYILGTSFLADSKKLEKTKTYSNLIKRILGNVEASLAKIDITKDGKITIKSIPFSEMEYQFQYHAPSHIPGNNLPGFHLVVK